MPRNGAGTYSLPSGNPVTTGTTISSTWANSTLSDISTSLTASIAYDGQTNPVANLPMSGYIHTNVGNATNRNNYASAAQVQDSTLTYLTSVSGTDTITAIAAVNMTTYVAGQTFRFIAAGSNTTTTVTLNINGIGAKNVVKLNGSALVAGDIVSGSLIIVAYDGTNFQLQTGLGVSTFSAGTTGLTPSTATNGAVTLGGVLGKLNGGTGALTATISQVSRSANVSTISTTSAHNFVTGDYVTVAATTNTGFNGSFTITGTPTSSSFTYAQVGSTVVATSDTGTVTDLSYCNLVQNVTGILYPNYGGTGVATIPQGNLVLGNATSAITTVNPASLGQAVIVSAGASVTAGSFVIGATYTITSVGTTSFTSIGAASNTVGVVFTATGVGSGTGTATLNTFSTGSAVRSATAVASTSGTSIDFTGIPSWVKRITVMFQTVSTSGTSSIAIQIGSGSVTTSGYVGSATNIAGTAATTSVFSNGFWISNGGGASDFTSGIATLTLITNNTWVFNSLMAGTDAARTRMSAGSSSNLAGSLDRVRITTSNGTDTFDAGTVNIFYE